MKKVFLSIFAIFLGLAVYGCGLNLEKESKNLTNYSAFLTYDDINQRILGNLEVDFVNNTNSNLQILKFNIFPNAFREGSKQEVISLAGYTDCYYNGKSFGNIEFNSVKTAGNEDLDFEVCGEDENILKIDLDKKVEPGKRTTVVMDFQIQIPNISHRFGYGENTTNLGNFLPTLCVLEKGDWVELLYSSNGDPFYSEVANYEVSVEYDKKFTLASTGQKLSTTESGGVLTSKISAKAVRDFAMIFSEKFEVLSGNVGDTKVNYYYYNDQTPEKSLQTSVNAVKTFNSLFGKYPYPEMNVAESNFSIGGMEFPNLVFIGDNIDDFETYQYVIVHEIAHQWWYGIVGNNQTKHSWLDEGLAEYSTALFYERNKGYETNYEFLVKKANTAMSVYQTVFESVFGEDNNDSMKRELSEFKSETEYVYNAYVKGFLMYDSLSSLLSEKVVIKCLKNYFKTYAFEIVTPELLIASFEKTTSCNLESIFNSWLDGKVQSFE